MLDAYLAKDPYARVACETAATKNTPFIMGEVTVDCSVNVDQVARETLHRIANCMLWTLRTRQYPFAVGEAGYGGGTHMIY